MLFYQNFEFANPPTSNIDDNLCHILDLHADCMGDIEKLLLFAETLGSNGVVDVENIRVCLPPDGPEDCVLLLDGANHVPPDDLFAQLGQFSTQNSATTNDAVTEHVEYIEEAQEAVSSIGLKTPMAIHELSSAEFACSAAQTNHYLEINPIDGDQADSGSPERDLPPKVLFSPLIHESASKDSTKDRNYMDVVAEPLCVVEEVERAEHHTDVPSCEMESDSGAFEASASTETIINVPAPALESEPAPAATSNIPVACSTLNLDFQGIIAAHRRRFESLSPHSTFQALESTCYSGDVVYYWVTQTFRVKDNLALVAAMRLSAELCVPLVAIVSV